MLFSMTHTHVACLSFSRLISIMFCELPLTYFHRLPERKLLSGGVDGLAKFCARNRMIVNNVKTKAMKFGRKLKFTLTFHDQKIDKVNNYKYPGNILSSTGRSGSDMLGKLMIIWVRRAEILGLISGKRSLGSGDCQQHPCFTYSKQLLNPF